jgi:hypothetical protein
MGRSVGQQILERVISKLGGEEAASLRLGLTRSLLQRMLDGKMPVPDSILLKAVDFALTTGPMEPIPAVQPFTSKRPTP